MAFVIPPPGARRLSELLDVSLTGPVDAQVLQYIAAQTRWEARTRAATRIRRQGSVGWLDGDVEMVGGSLLALTQDDGAKSITFSPTDQKRPRNLDLFVPSTLAARTILIARGIPDPVVRKVDAYFGTAPGTGTDGANNARLRVRGSTSGTLDQIYNALQAEWHLAEGDLSSESGKVSTAGTQQFGGPAWAIAFDPSAALTLQSFEITPNAAFTAGPVRLGFSAAITGNGTYNLSTTPWLTDAQGNPAWIELPVSDFASGVAKVITLAAPVSLTQGVTYMVVAQNQVPATGVLPAQACSTAPTYTGSIISPVNGLWGAYTIGGAPYNWVRDNPFPVKIRVFGTTLGAVLVGDVIAEVVMTGTPVEPGANLLATVHL